MTLTEQERHDIDRANELGRQPVVLVHGLWLLSSSWDPWRTFIEDNGFVAVAPGWPDDPETVAEGRENPEVFARKMIGAVTDHYAEAISLLTRKPALIGHSFQAGPTSPGPPWTSSNATSEPRLHRPHRLGVRATAREGLATRTRGRHDQQ